MPPRNRRAPARSSTNDNNDNDNDNEKSAPSSKQSRSSTTETSPSLKPYPITTVNRLIEPGPVLLVTTGSLKERTHNIMTIGFHMMIQHESPPLIGVVIGPWDASFALLQKHEECVLAIPSVEMAATVVNIGNCSGDEVNKFDVFGLETVQAARVDAPLVTGLSESKAAVMANVECVVEDTNMVRPYNMWVLRVVKAWIHPEYSALKSFHHRGDGTFVVDGEKLDLRERMTKWKEYQD